MTLKLRPHPSAKSWLDATAHRRRADPFADLTPARIVGRYVGRQLKDECFATLENEGEIVGVLVHTPPWNVLIDAEMKFVPFVAELVRQRYRELGHASVPGITGKLAFVDALAANLQNDVALSARYPNRLYAFAGNAEGSLPAATRLRPATIQDRSLLLDWTRAFWRDVETPFFGDIERLVDSAIVGGLFDLLEVEGIPVCMGRGERAHGATIGHIGLIYTPGSLRGRGYAGEISAAIARRLFREGASNVTLYTELSNPASNRAYQRVGYRFVCDDAQIYFAETKSGFCQS